MYYILFRDNWFKMLMIVSTKVYLNVEDNFCKSVIVLTCQSYQILYDSIGINYYLLIVYNYNSEN